MKKLVTGDIDLYILSIQPSSVTLSVSQFTIKPERDRELESKVGGKATPSWDGLHSLLWLHGSGEMPPCPIQLQTLADFASLQPFPRLVQPFHRGHPGMKWDAWCCMAQLSVCVTAIHQRIFLHTLWCWHPSGPGHPLWLFSQSHFFLVSKMNMWGVCLASISMSL